MKKIALFLAAFCLCSFSELNITKKGIVVVHYNAEFNSSNNYTDIVKIKDAKIFKAWIDKDPTIKVEEGIRSVPTIVVYKNGKEIKRWEAGLSLSLKVPYLEIQSEIDKLTGANKW